MLNRPKLGMKNATTANTRLRVAKLPQNITKKVVLKGKNPFAVFKVFMWDMMQDLRDQTTDRVSTACGLRFSPKNVSFSNTVSNPPVVGVAVAVMQTKIIWRGT